MEFKQANAVRAIHPDWPDKQGILRLSNQDDSVIMDGLSFRGKYEFAGNRLVIRWDKFPADRFLLLSNGVYLSEKIPVPKIDDLFSAELGPMKLALASLGVVVPGTDYELHLRTGTSDINVFWQIFGAHEYESEDLPAEAEYIIDLGANIGLASVYFGLRYPNASIACLEPDESNFGQLLKNVARLSRVPHAILGGAWMDDSLISLVNKDEQGHPLGAWANQTASSPLCSTVKFVQGYSLSKILTETGFPRVDILKVDIEGAEIEVFSASNFASLSKVELVIVETHDRFRPGSESTVRAALSNEFIELLPKGENLFFRRKRHISPILS